MCLVMRDWKVSALFCLCVLFSGATSFVPNALLRVGVASGQACGSSTTVVRNFFKDMIEGAFANDVSLPQNKRDGQYDKPGDEFKDDSTSALTDVQQKWRSKQLGNAVTDSMVEGSTCLVDLYLAGIAERDPSNDLYGSKINISSRDKSTGLSLPDEPSVTFEVEFLPDGICTATPSAFTTGSDLGQWKLSDTGDVLRFSFECSGFTRTVQTTGTIQKIYWSKDDEKTTKTSTSYSIPPGLVYADVPVKPGRQPGTLEFGRDGVLRIEKKMGLLGAASRMEPCGRVVLRPKP